MTNYPVDRPTSAGDVMTHHIAGKVTEINAHNSLWLRDALDLMIQYALELEHELDEVDGGGW